MRMRVGVTGASGFIGSALVEALLERGDDVVRFVRPTSDAVRDGAVRWDPSKGDVDDGDLRQVGGLDAAVHLAGAGVGDHRWTESRKLEILTSRVQSTALLVRTLAELPGGVAVLASGSAIGYYGSRGAETLDESASSGHDFLADVCVRWEQAASTLRDRGTAKSFLRTGIVMSASGGALARQLPLFRLGLGGRLSSGQQWFSPISLRDQVRAILWVVDHQVDGPVNLVGPRPLTNREFTRELARQLHRPARATVPSFALRAALGRELADVAVLASQRVRPGVLLDGGFVFEHPDTTAILEWALRH